MRVPPPWVVVAAATGVLIVSYHGSERPTSLRATESPVSLESRAPSASPTFVDYVTEVWLSAERTRGNFTRAQAAALCRVDAPAHCVEIVPLLRFDGVDPVDLSSRTSVDADASVSHHHRVVAHDLAGLFASAVNMEDWFWSGVHVTGRAVSPEGHAPADCGGWTGVGEAVVGWTTFDDDLVDCRHGVFRVPCVCSYAV